MSRTLDPLALLAALGLLLLGCDGSGTMRALDGGDDGDDDGDDDGGDDDTGDDDGGDDDAGDDDGGDDDAGDDDAGDDDSDPGDREWTLLVFINADNNLEENGLEDISEMELVGSTPEVSVVVQIDRHSGYTQDDGDWTGARRYLVTEDQDMSSIGSPVLEDLGEVDMGQGDTAVAFFEWGVENYPAPRVGFVFWNHGDGWSARGPGDEPLKGLSSDDQSGHSISVAEGELEDALDQMTDVLGRKLDLLGFDACLMGMWEVAVVSAPYADVLVASEASEGVDGWEYTESIGALVSDPEMTPGELGDAISHSFVQSGDETQSVVDLTRIGAVTAAVDDLATVALSKPEAVLDEVEDAIGGAQDFSWMPHRDLAHIGTRLAANDDADISAAGVALRDAVDDAVIAAYSANYLTSDGIAIYAPVGSWWWNYDADYHTGAGATWAQETSWDELLQEF